MLSYLIHLFSYIRYPTIGIFFCVCAVLFGASFAHAAEYPQYLPGTQVTIGEFVYDDDFQATTTAGCTVTVYDPTGSTAVNAASMTASANSWYQYTFTPSSIYGVWPTIITCGSASNGSLVRSDETFQITDNLVSSSSVASLVNANTNTVVATASSSLASTLPSSIWNFSSRTLTSFGTLVSDIWSAGTRTLTSGASIAADIWGAATRTLTDATLSSGTLATQNDVQTASSSLGTAISNSQTAINSNTNTTVQTASSSLANVINTNTNTTVLAASSSLATAIPVNVWNATTRSLTTFGTLVSDIWSAGSRTLTGFGTLAADVWTNGTRTLTGAGLSSGSLATLSDVQTASSSLNSAITASQTAINANTDSRVGTASSSLASVINANTNTTVQTASSSLASVINTNTNATVLTASTSLGLSLSSIASSITAIPANVWAAGTRTLTSFGTLASDVWTNGTRTLTGATLSSGSLAVQSDVITASSSLGSAITNSQTAINSNTNTTVQTASSSIAAVVNGNTNATILAASSSLATSIPINVWNATTRTLTGFGTLASDVWSAATRTLTGAGLSSGSLATLSDVQTASSSVASVVNANTDSRVGTASSSLASVINANTNSTLQTASTSLASVINANTNTAVLTASTSLGSTLASISSSITALPTAIWNVATSTMTTAGSIGKVLATNVDSMISAVGGGSLTVADIWNYTSRTLTGATLSSGSLATQSDVQNASSSLAAALTTKATLVNQQAGWTVRQSDFGTLLAGSTYRTKVTVLNYQSQPTTPFATPTVTVYDSARNVVASNVSMTQISTGVYEYTYSVASLAAQGQWESVISTQVESGKTIQTNDYFEVAGSPAQVLIQSMGSLVTPNITANVRITNEGLADYEYQYEWCVVSNINNPCGGGDDVYYASAAKLIAAGQNFDTVLSATVPAEGVYYFKTVVYFGTQSSGASRQFTTSLYVPPPPPPSGGGGGAGGGGGGGGASSSPTPTPGSCGIADINCDGKVSAVDFSIMLAYWKTFPPFANPRVDLNGDKKVNAVDFSILLYHWGTRYK